MHDEQREDEDMRKQTKFHLCTTHAHLSTAGRQRLAELFCEGGPAFGKACDELKPCRVRPGSDLFAPSATDDVADAWVNDWAINQTLWLCEA